MKNYFIFISLFTIISISIFPQSSCNDYKNGYSEYLSEKKVDNLISILETSQNKLETIARGYFSDLYEKELPDLICYVNKDGIPKIGLLQDCETKYELFGERFIWVLLVSRVNLNADKRVNLNADIKDKSNIDDSCTVNLDVLQYETDPSEGKIQGIVSAFSELILGKSPAEKSASTQGEPAPPASFKLKEYKGSKESLYIGMKKFKLGLNTRNRVVIKPAFNDNNAKFLFADYNFGNFEKSIFGASVGAGITIGRKDWDTLNIVDLYILGHLYLYRPRLPVSSFAVSLVIGTNFVNQKILNHIVFGAHINLWSPVGVFCGANWLKDSDNKRIFKPLVGLDYRF
jgi:hypothetical protein